MIIDKILEKEYKYIGIRHLTDDEVYNIGDICRLSYDWDYKLDCSTYETNKSTLDGTCAYDTNINYFWDNKKEIEDKLQIAIDKSDCYFGDCIIIGGNIAIDGNDYNEIIIKDAEVIFIL